MGTSEDFAWVEFLLGLAVGMSLAVVLGVGLVAGLVVVPVLKP